MLSLFLLSTSLTYSLFQNHTPKYLLPEEHGTLRGRKSVPLHLMKMSDQEISPVPVGSAAIGPTVQLHATPGCMPLRVRSGQNYQSEVVRNGKVVRSEKAKNITKLFMATYNTRTLQHEERFESLEVQLKETKWDVIEISEMRKKGECLAKRENGHLIYNMGNNNEAKNGVGFVINKRLENHIEEIVGINERIAYSKLK